MTDALSHRWTTTDVQFILICIDPEPVKELVKINLAAQMWVDIGLQLSRPLTRKAEAS
jgi:hypothetical protein